jgi:hypothetical protein
MYPIHRVHNNIHPVYTPTISDFHIVLITLFIIKIVVIIVYTVVVIIIIDINIY